MNTNDQNRMLRNWMPFQVTSFSSDGEYRAKGSYTSSHQAMQAARGILKHGARKNHTPIRTLVHNQRTGDLIKTYRM